MANHIISDDDVEEGFILDVLKGYVTYQRFFKLAKQIADDPELEGIDKISRHYTGNPYPVRDQPRVDVWISIDKVHGWGATAK